MSPDSLSSWHHKDRTYVHYFSPLDAAEASASGRFARTLSVVLGLLTDIPSEGLVHARGHEECLTGCLKLRKTVPHTYSRREIECG